MAGTMSKSTSDLNPVGSRTVHEPEQIIKSKQRIADHGEVFTPAHIVGAMLDLAKDESERIDSRSLESTTSDFDRISRCRITPF